LTGCSHAGVINTINYAKKVTGVDEVYVVMGGFHLPESTVDALQKADPKYIVPCHCTGWKATNRIIQTMAEKFIKCCRYHFSVLTNKWIIHKINT
jgi:7,8-dihydropterin-6-yl-methyl-4-(beta-D-ribofuranosyl)aminobenzene 5'-phosphate synthase